MDLETLGQCHFGQRGALQTIGLLAVLTVEVWMLVVIMVVAAAMAEFVPGTVAAPFDGMYQMVLTKQREGTEHIGLVDRDNPPLQLCQR